MTPAARSPLSIRQQGAFIEGIVSNCTMVDGKLAAETYVLMTAEEVRHLQHLAMRLHRMAPHEDQIKALVLRHDNA